MDSFSHDIVPQGSPERGRLGRPSFSSQKTADRLRECERRPSIATISKIKPQRRSVFREEGLDDLSNSVYKDGPDIDLGSLHEGDEDGFTMEADGDKNGGVVKESRYDQNCVKDGGAGQPWYSKLSRGSRPVIKSSATAPPGSFSSIPRVALIVFLVAVVVPGFRYGGGEDKVNIGGVDAGVIRTAELVENASTIEGRADSPTSTCTRWAAQIANVNGTVYIYGGQAKSASGQTTDTWSKQFNMHTSLLVLTLPDNNFLTLDLTKSWSRDEPELKGLPQPSGPPAVAMGSLWNSYTSLFLYGGQFSDNPPEAPLPVSTWEYDINAAKWIEWNNPRTSTGNHSEAGDMPVQRSAEGAGLSVPELGKSWYFGGHLDMYTTEGWSNQVARVYLRSMLEFTHPGYANSGIDSLGTTKAAPQGGAYRNITEGGLQDSAGFTERADGVLVYIPGWGDEGIVLGLAGGTNATFTEMDTIDIYDVANSTWYKQATSGESPPIRVNPCVGVVAAPDGTSFQVHLYGGQNLIPFGSQIQYSDMWILTIPSFTWIQVPMDGQSQPAARAGHQCTMWDSQMVVIGGYVGKDISCDSPGIFVFNTSSLEWQNNFISLSPSSSDSSDTPGTSGSGSFSEDNGYGYSIIQGSRGYQVPALVQSVIGGGSQGGATATSPAVGAATAGPIATGKPPTFTVTQSGSIVTQTASPGSGSGSSNGAKPEKSGTNVGAVVAGVIAGLLAILAAYLAFCSWLYRKQLKLYKNHVAMAQRTAFTNSPENAMYSSDAGSDRLAAVRSHEKPHGVVLGPFGTEIGGSGTPGSSVGRSSTGSRLTPGSGMQESSSGQGSYGYGGGVMPGGRYGRMSEGDEGVEYLGATDPGSYGRPGGSLTANSSVEDLLGGQEPSFFSVVLNPRRTLRVVNLD
ncbi:hypothetical protein ONS95_004936 [Cadophora gregata]|uniref:uncharacterized protein n=1 Tax=Cadophora gregata TaxID=51156 RepID=UPI0026DACF18|nr:uncharacterized protein ONS95_004936 [Cadophora gregata]KAK0104661.1 hypothetical protein ONS95_004936 [Cadophora gregata]